VLVLDMIEILPPLGKYKYDTWRIVPVKCYIDNSVCLWSCIRNINSTLWLDKHICVPNLKHIKELILRESHDSTYSIHPGSIKRNQDLKTKYWWYNMKRDVWQSMLSYTTLAKE
jgi:hypothetical protein